MCVGVTVSGCYYSALAGVRSTECSKLGGPVHEGRVWE